jgi:hypothetical protein
MHKFITKYIVKRGRICGYCKINAGTYHLINIWVKYRHSFSKKTPQ